MILLAAAACRSGAKAPASESPTTGPGTKPAPEVVAPVDPIPPIRGLDPSLTVLLGLDMRGAPAEVDADATARFVTLSSRHDDARGDIVNELTMYGFFDGALTTETTVEIPAPGV